MPSTSPKTNPFRPDDLLGQVMIQEVALSPDGSFVIFSRRTIEDGKYRRRLWRVDFEGGSPEQLTAAAATDGAPRISPDGTTLVFLSDRTGTNQPWELPLAGGEARQLLDLAGGVRKAEWSPDGKRLALVGPSGTNRFLVGRSEDPVARRVADLTWRLDGVGVRDQFNSAWVARASGSKPKRIVSPDVEVHDIFWSPDSQRVGVLIDLSDGAALMETPQAYAVSVRGGAPERLASLDGAILAASWSSRGALAFIGNDRSGAPEWANCGLYVADDDGLRQLAADADMTMVNSTYGDLIDPDSYVSMCWSDPERIVVIASAQGAALPFRFTLDGGMERLADGELVCSSVAAVGESIVVVATDRGRAAEVYAVEDGSLRPLTTTGSRWMEPWRRDPERHRVEHPEGRAIDAWLVPARGRRRNRPLVVQVHGGPHASHGPTPWLEMIALADAGIHVLYPNPTGSTGYGEDFARALHGCWGDPDGSDITALVEWAVGAGLTEPGRVGVLGLSYGGYMVNWLLGHHPGLFAAGVSENPVTDMVGEFGTSDFGIAVDETAVGAGTLPDDIDEFLRRSPYLELSKNEAPLLLLQSEDDLRCPPGQSELVFTLLRARGEIVEMVRYPGESHYLVGTGRPDRRVDRMERIVDWFERYLADPGATKATRRAR